MKQNKQINYTKKKGSHLHIFSNCSEGQKASLKAELDMCKAWKGDLRQLFWTLLRPRPDKFFQNLQCPTVNNKVYSHTVNVWESKTCRIEGFYNAPVKWVRGLCSRLGGAVGGWGFQKRLSSTVRGWGHCGALVGGIMESWRLCSRLGDTVWGLGALWRLRALRWHGHSGY